MAPRTWEALVSWPIPGPFHQELNSPSSADLVAPMGAHLAKPEGRWVLVVSPARALCSSSRYRISGASIFQSHKTVSNTASGGPSHHAKISHGGCGCHSGLGRTLRARTSIPNLQDGSLGGAVRHSVNSTRRYFVPIRLFAAADDDLTYVPRRCPCLRQSSSRKSDR